MGYSHFSYQWDNSGAWQFINIRPKMKISINTHGTIIGLAPKNFPLTSHYTGKII